MMGNPLNFLGGEGIEPSWPQGPLDFESINNEKSVKDGVGHFHTFLIFSR